MPWDNTRTVHPGWLAVEFGTCVGVRGDHGFGARGDQLGDGEARLARDASAAGLAEQRSGFLARVLSVEVPVPDDRAHVSRVRPRDHGEAADRALPAFVVGIEEVDGQPHARLDGAPHVGVRVVAHVPDGSLPEADIPGWHIQVPRLTTEGVRIAVRP